MYRNRHYIKDEQGFITDFIQNHPFATLVSSGDPLQATHIPVLLDTSGENWRLFSHIANHNEQLQYVNDGAEVLVIFHGPNAYISSSWYREKDISTWDYSAVHVNANVVIQNREELEDCLRTLVQKFESQQENPLYLNNIPEDLILDHITEITGFWLEPFKVQGISKHHQAYQKEDVKRVINNLGQCDRNHSELIANIKKENNL